MRMSGLPGLFAAPEAENPRFFLILHDGPNRGPYNSRSSTEILH